MTSQFPLVSVIMPVFNCSSYIEDAVQSILDQTYYNFELIIIDDFSQDETVSLIEKFDDKRINIIKKSKNTGLTNSLNYGLKLANGKYIARMDGDDISMPERFEKQVAFLEANPDIIVCGTLYSIIGTNEVVHFPEKHEDIKFTLLQHCCIAHPTVMMRKNFLDENGIIYDVDKEPAEDYALWGNLVRLGKFHNMQESLLLYRLHNMQVSQKRIVEQQKSAINTRLSLLNSFGIFFDKFELELLRKVITDCDEFDFKEILGFLNIKDELVSANSTGFFNEERFSGYLIKMEHNLLKKYFFKRTTYLPIIFCQYVRMKVTREYRLILIHEIKLFIKSFLFYRSK